MRALGIPRAALPTPHWEPAARLRPPSPGPWGVAHGRSGMSGWCAEADLQAIEGRRPEAGLTSGNVDL